MRGKRLLLVAMTAWLAVAAGPVLAHEGEEGSGIAVEPEQVTAGGTVVLSGTGLEADDERSLQLVGGDVTVQLGMATTDADGMFTVELTIPAYLPGGSYELQAIGDETLTTELAVTAGAGAAATTSDGSDATVVPRSWTPIGIVIAAGVIVLLIGVGVLLVRRSDRFARPSAAPTDAPEPGIAT